MDMSVCYVLIGVLRQKEFASRIQIMGAFKFIGEQDIFWGKSINKEIVKKGES